MLILDTQWDQTLNLVHFSPMCARHGLIQCKFFTKYIIQMPDYQEYIQVTATLDNNRCWLSPANQTHMFCSCTVLTAFWQQIFNTLGTVLGVNLTPESLTALDLNPLFIQGRSIESRLSFQMMLPMSTKYITTHTQYAHKSQLHSDWRTFNNRHLKLSKEIS